MKYSFQLSVISYQLIFRILIVAGLGCGLLWSTQLFDGVKAVKQFWFVIVVCVMVFFLSGRALLKKNAFVVSLSIPDLLLTLYAVWAFVRLITSDADSIHNLYFWEFAACVIWYFCLRIFFNASAGKDRVANILYFFILMGYVQMTVCVLQLIGTIPSFSQVFSVSGAFRNTSELCIYLTCVLPVAVHTGLRAKETTSSGKMVRAICVFYILCWLAFVLILGSRTSLLAGLMGMGVYWGFQTGVFNCIKGIIRKTVVLSILLFVVCGLVFLLAQYKKDSANGRLLIWKSALSGIKETPLLGQGFNAFQARYMHFQAAYFQQHTDNEMERMIADNMLAALNDYVETNFNLGVIGLFLFVGFWLSVLFCGAKALKHEGVNVVSMTVLVIFLVSSGFYFVEKMLSVKVIALFFAAYAGSFRAPLLKITQRTTEKTQRTTEFRLLALKSIAVILLFFSCFSGYATISKIKYYAQWEKANSLNQFGYVEEARTAYERIYSHLRHNGQFLYMYARNLYKNKDYQKSLEYLESAKPKIATNNFYDLMGDIFVKTGDFEKAISCYKYVSFMIPNRFRPLYKQFILYEELGQTDQAMEIAQSIVNKPVKVDSYEIRDIIKACNNFIRLKEYEQKNSIY